MIIVRFNNFHPFEAQQHFERAAVQQFTNRFVVQQLTNHFVAQQLIHQLVAQIFIQSFFQSLFQPQSFSPRQYTYQPQQRQLPVIRQSSQPQQSSREAQLRRQLNIAPNEEFYTGAVARMNEESRNRAKATNQDGGAFLKGIIARQSPDFKTKVAESDPDVFASNGIPTLAVKELISSRVPLTQTNTPKFAHSYLTDLETLRKNQANKNLHDKITTAMSRDKDFIAAIQNAV